MFHTGVVVELVALRLGQELLVGDEPVLVDVGLLEHVLAHPLHLLLSLPHVVLRSIWIVHLVQLLLEQHPDLVLVPVVVAVQVVHGEERLGVPLVGPHVILVLPDFFQLILGHWMMDFAVFFMLLFLLVEPVLLLLPFGLVVDVIQALLLLELLLHLVPFEVVSPLAIGLLQIFCRSLDQALEIVDFKGGRLDFDVLGNLQVLLVDALSDLILAHG